MFIGITTAPRPDGVSYLETTLSSIYHAGFRSDVHIRAEPGSNFGASVLTPGLMISTHKNEFRLGNHNNFLALATDLIQFAEAFDEEYIITCEDDVVFSRDCKEKIRLSLDSLTANDERFGFLALYTSSIYQRAIPEGIHYYKAPSLWGACALAWTVESLRAVITHKDFTGWRGLNSNPPPVGHPDICHVDTCIGNVLIKLKRKTFFMRPSVCQHIGEVSSLRKVKLTDERKAAHVL